MKKKEKKFSMLTEKNSKGAEKVFTILNKKNIEQVKKEFIDGTSSWLGKLLINIFVIQCKVVDSKYYKNNKDYSFYVRLNKFNPISYVLVFLGILIGIFTNVIDYHTLWKDLKASFNWIEQHYTIKDSDDKY